MIIWFLISIGLALAYTFLIYDIYNNWQDQTDWVVPQVFKGETNVSIIVAARNEAQNIGRLLKSLEQNAQTYASDLLEIIIVNDHSEDNTAEIINAYGSRFKLINLDYQSGKKAAIAKGIESAKGKLIITTDADCILPDNWINSFVSFYEAHDVSFIAAPVICNAKPKLIHRLQLLDLSGMMGVTQAGIHSKKWFMGNGANMAFEKSAYHKVKGFEKNKEWASGDDMFLVQSIALENKTKVAFIKTPDAVLVDPEKDTNDFIKQRLRWGTKNKSYSHKGVLKTLGLVFLFSVSILLNIVLIPFFGSFLFFIFLFQFFIKLTIDYLYLNRMTEYFHQEKAMKKYLMVAPMYLIYLVGIGISSLFVKNYTWKGRAVQ